MEAILISEAKYARKAIKHNPIELALDELLGFLVYDSKVSMNYEKIHYELKRAKLKFQMPSFSNLYATDKEFSDITQKLCDAFLIEKPSKDLYAILEKSGIDMLTTHRVSKKISKTSDYGSDSEFSYDDISNDGVASRAFFHKKLRVCSGMKAIMLAQYTALHYLRSKYAKEVQCHYGSDASQMYYEVPDALNLVSSPDKMLEDKIRSNENILLFDLNHCNASNTSQNSTTLSTKLNNDEKISIAILDYTSSTVLQIEQSIQLCFKKPKIELIMLVESGLKNSQGGIDLNPYGEFRIFCRTKKMLDQVFDIAKLGLSEKDKLSGITHEMVRVCKARGMEMSLLGHFKSSSKRFASIDPNTPIINNGIN